MPRRRHNWEICNDGKRADQVSSKITLFGIGLIWLMAQISLAVGHDSWINRGGYGNPAGEWCCGDNDCDPDQIVVTGKGWVVGGTEFVPFEEATRARTERNGFAEGLTTRAAACSVRRPARDAGPGNDTEFAIMGL